MQAELYQTIIEDNYKINSYSILAMYLIDNYDYYFKANVSIHSLVDENGKVLFYENFKGQCSPYYASIKTLCEKRNIELPINLDIKHIQDKYRRVN